MAAAATIPNNIVDTTTNDAARPMANWNAILTWINANAVHLDGSKAMTGTLSGPAGVDPVSANEYSRKAYTDARDAVEAAARLAADINPPQHGEGIARVANQNIAAATPTLLAFDSLVWQSNAAYGAVPNNFVTIPASDGGVHLVTYDARVSGVVSASNSIELMLNGANLATVSGGNGNVSSFVGSGLYFLVPGDQLSIRVTHGSGGVAAWIGRISIIKLSL